MSAPPILDGWAAVAASGRGVDEDVRASGRGLAGRSLRGYVEGRGEIATSTVAQCARVAGRWVVLTVTGSHYILGEAVWTKVARRAVAPVAQIGSER